MSDLSSNPKEWIWFQKYRPRSVSECILPQTIKDTFQEFVDQQRIPNLILCGPKGGGKTSIAVAACEDIGANYLFINASEDSGIDTIRTKIRSFATSYSIVEGRKVIILDEADGLSSNAQDALKSGVEEFSKSCSFIFTCNNYSKIIEPLQSRCSTIMFEIRPEERPVIAKTFWKRACQILDSEGVQYDKGAIAELITNHFPDFRRIINEMQRLTRGGVFDAGGIGAAGVDEQKFKDLVAEIKARKFNNIRRWVATNNNYTSDQIFRKFYDAAQDLLTPKSVPELVMIVAEYSYKSAFVIDKEINTMAALIEIMLRCEWVE